MAKKPKRYRSAITGGFLFANVSKALVSPVFERGKCANI